MTSRTLVAGALQMCSGSDISANLAVCRRLAAEAADVGVNLLVLPENFAFLGEHERDKFAVAELVSRDSRSPDDTVGSADESGDVSTGPILAAVQEIAATHQMWVIGGGMAELVGDGPREEISRTYNACVAISPDGELAAVYRKIHLFDVDIPGGAVLRESDTTAAGVELVSVETPLCRIGLSICYDLRFPELYRDLTVNHGVQVIVVPAAFTAFTGAAHWHVLLRSRAIENQCYIVAAAQFGRHNEKRESYGHSLIIDPWGDIVAEKEDGEGLAIAELDLDHLKKVRQRMPCLDHQVLLR